MNKRIFAVIFILFVFLDLHALLNDRISGNKIPSLTASVSLEKSDFLYNAPLIQYLNLNFGLMVNRFQKPGLSFGIDWQWLDGEHVAGTLRADGVFLTNRTFSGIYLGAYVDATISAGVKISGFKGVIHTSFLANPASDDDPLVALELQLGAYVSPHDSFNLYFAPACGRYFLDKEYFYFNLILSAEIFLWK